MLRYLRICPLATLIALGMLGCLYAGEGGETAEKNKTIAREIVKNAFEKGDFSYIDKYIAEDFVDHARPEGMPPGREGVRAVFTMIRNAFPDIQVTLEDEIATGDKVVHRATVSGTHKGEFMGMPATNKKATWTEIHILRVQDGMIAEHWGLIDHMTMLKQLGLLALPKPEHTEKQE